MHFKSTEYLTVSPVPFPGIAQLKIDYTLVPRSKTEVSESGLFESSEGDINVRASFLVMVLFSISPVFGQQPKEFTNSIGMKLVLIPAGTFTMGSSKEERGRHSAETQHEVTVSTPFYLGKYEVTQNEYEKLMGNNPSSIKGPTSPVETLRWKDAVSFCEKLSELPEEKAAGREYRLPTEAEWEFSCRGGSETAYGFADSSELLHEHAWFAENAQNKHHPVGEKKPNRWGLHDMHGNVWEWCKDWYGDYPSGALTDPQGPSQGSERVIRGGSWPGAAETHFRSAYRANYVPTDRSVVLGFRVALNASNLKP